MNDKRRKRKTLLPLALPFFEQLQIHLRDLPQYFLHLSERAQTVSTGLIGNQNHQNQRPQGTIWGGPEHTDAAPPRWDRGGRSDASSLRAA